MKNRIAHSGAFAAFPFVFVLVFAFTSACTKTPGPAELTAIGAPPSPSAIEMGAPASGRTSETGAPPRPVPAIAWDETRVAAIAAKLSPADLVGVQVLVRASLAGSIDQPGHPCVLSDEWKVAGSQYFLGEWESRFGRKRPLKDEKICDAKVESLEGDKLLACARSLVERGLCARFQ